MEEEVLDHQAVLQIHKHLLDQVADKVVEDQVLTLVLMLVLDLNHHNHKVFLLQIIYNMEILVELEHQVKVLTVARAHLMQELLEHHLEEAVAEVELLECLIQIKEDIPSLQVEVAAKYRDWETDRKSVV